MKTLYELFVKQLVDYLSVCKLNTSGEKMELVARAFAAFELKMDINYRLLRRAISKT